MHKSTRKLVQIRADRGVRVHTKGRKTGRELTRTKRLASYHVTRS